MKNFKEFLEESKSHGIISNKLKDMNSLKKFSYPTPEERKAQLAKEKEKEKKEVKESVDESNYKTTKNKQKSIDKSEHHDVFHGEKHIGSINTHEVYYTPPGKRKGSYVKRYTPTVNSGHHSGRSPETNLIHRDMKTKRGALEVIMYTHGEHLKLNKKNESEDLDEKENQEHEFIKQSLAGKDINSHIKDGKVVVHKSNASKAKTHLKKIGHGDLEVVHEGFEELDEAMIGHTTKSLSKHVKSLGWTLARTDGSHDVYKHPKSQKNLAIPRHAGELSRPTVKQMLKRAEFREGEEMLSFKEFITEQLDEGTHYHSVWFKSGRDSDWQHSFDADNKEDAADEKESLKGEVHKVKVLKVPKSQADWRKPEHRAAAIKRLNEGVEEQEDLMEDLHDKVSNHIRRLRDAGHHVVITDRGSDGRSAKFVATDKEGNKRLHTVTMNSVKHEKIGGKNKEDDEAQETQKRGRGRPVGSKSGARA